MKQISFIVILAACFAVFAQADKDQLKAAKISEYWDDPGSENVKWAIYDLGEHLQENLTSEGVVKIQAKENKRIIRELLRIKTLFNFRGIELNRISFAINNNDKEVIQYWLVPLNGDIPDCKDCMIIRAEDFDKLMSFFYPKSKPKERKK